MDDTDEFWETYIAATPDEDKHFDPSMGKGLAMLVLFALGGLAAIAVIAGWLR